MNIIEKTYKWAGDFAYRKTTEQIILHHAAAKSCTPDDIHAWHLARGYTGIGYHYVVRKDGSVYRGRPEDTVGAHASASGANYNSIGVCFEGSFDVETMPEVQAVAGCELVQYLKDKHGVTKVIGHGDVPGAATACPGKYFPLDRIASGQGNTEKEEGYTMNMRNLYNGCEGEDVRSLQILLIGHGYSCGSAAADGIFGAGTESAVRRYQDAKKLGVDGIVGPKTMSRLLGV